MVSIIIPIFNGKQYIEKVLDSCLDQTYKNIEIIVVDDGSTDGLELPTSYKENKIIKFYSKINEGLGLTRNFGIKKAQGKYIFFLDVDDYIPNTSIELLVNAINAHDVAIGKCVRVFYDKENCEYSRIVWKEKIYKNVHDKFDLLPDTLVTNKLYKKDFLTHNNIYFEKGLYEDKLFMLKVLTNMEHYTLIDAVIYEWRVEYNSNSITNQLTINNLLARMEVIYQCLDYTSEDKVKKAIIANTIKHDLKIYVNVSSNYSFKELLELYSVYLKFVNKYAIYIKDMSFKENKKIIENISSKYTTIHEFLNISKKKSKVNPKDKRYTFRDIILKIFLKIEKIGIKQ